MQALSTAASGLTYQQKNVDDHANNIANLMTTAFKRSVTVPKDLAYLNYQSAGTPTSSSDTMTPTGMYMGMGVRAAGIMRVMEQGEIEITDNPLDVMVQGEGFFQVELPTGETGFTRDGRFSLNPERQLITLEGYKVKPDLSLPAEATKIEINRQGQVYATIQGQPAPVLVGQFEMATFANTRGLEPIGNNLYKETVASGSPTSGVADAIGFGAILQNALEGSNVKPVVELTALIEAQRAYAMNTKTMNAVEEMDRNLETLMR
ncbi:MAG: flagellar basal-body rod protein FlgG [Alphaproteobacteria bacterium]|nr:flagellar basal-body rod protein FlgG [Alphaproteobacteria bacterium]